MQMKEKKHFEKHLKMLTDSTEEIFLSLDVEVQGLFPGVDDIRIMNFID